ncbi:NAD(P)H-dependent glycerol-3-phosphate dehydrogenase [Mycoplasma todarodis]|uniref:Glycerol-3-phosphate dehydrogenase [NAD(P)+] n=1 Tax=Mycoplasma todarodis TaxID=1937191 RepID=A0A4R0XM20_9MOLU|nr:NAD(P)H-dependent glycerol-3-phosphate dehydrogenase [Mycoplasma todarodis]TCG10472.1 glycerol-3-phosphate dehydrogenase [Mycoplasma todarodis]
MNKKITIIGSGALGTSLAKVLVDAGHTNIVVYGIDEQELKELENGKNTKYFPETIKLPKLKTESNLKIAISNASYIVTAVPSFTMKGVIEEIQEKMDSEALLINGSKGFYPESSLSLHEGMTLATNENKNIRGVVSLIGPSHAEEIVKEAPTTICAVDVNEKLAEEVQELFKTTYFRVYVQTDVKGAEVGAAYKNVLAIAAGMIVEEGMGINTIAGLLTRGLNEMLIFAKAIGGKEKTVIGLTGVGDLIVTAMSDHSRNRQFGRSFVRDGAEKALGTNKTVEGLVALKNIYKIGKENNLELPLAYSLYAIIFEGAKLVDLQQRFWNRDLKAE